MKYFLMSFFALFTSSAFASSAIFVDYLAAPNQAADACLAGGAPLRLGLQTSGIGNLEKLTIGWPPDAQYPDEVARGFSATLGAYADINQGWKSFRENFGDALVAGKIRASFDGTAFVVEKKFGVFSSHLNSTNTLEFSATGMLWTKKSQSSSSSCQWIKK
jgi:hypothetical protein